MSRSFENSHRSSEMHDSESGTEDPLEHVLLVVDGDDVDGLRFLDETNIAWEAFRHVASQACTSQNSRFYTPVGDVTAAHYFSTIWPPWEEKPNQHGILWNRSYRYFTDRGYISHLRTPVLDITGRDWVEVEHKAEVRQLLRESINYFDTLIMVGDVFHYADLCAEFARRKTRAFIVDDTSASKRNYCEERNVSLIDIGRLIIFHSQTIRARIVNAERRLILHPAV
jgi:hypothetical protein